VATTDLVSDDLWEAAQPLLPPEPCRSHGGPPRVPHRAALTGILYVLRHGLRWRNLPLELGLRQRQHLLASAAPVAGTGRLAAGAPGRPELAGRSGRDRLELRQSGQHQYPSQTRRRRHRPNPTNRGKAGSKYHVLVDRPGVPLAVQLSAANVHDSKLLEPLVDAVEPIRRPMCEPGRPRKRPAKLHGDKGFDYPHLRQALRQRGITPRIARRGVASSERLGRFRWVVEPTPRTEEKGGLQDRPIGSVL
jgi:transposase